MSELIAITGKTGLPLIADPDKKLRSFQPTAAIHFQRYIHGANGNAPVIQHDSTVILDARAFEGGGDGIPKMRDYIKDIRKEHINGSNPHILCLRFDTHDAGIERNDMKAGATATLFYMGNIPDATRRMNAFIETGVLPSARKGRVTTVMDSAPFNLFRDASDSDGDDLPDDTQPKTTRSSSPLINDTPQSRHPASIPAKPTQSSVPKRSGESTGVKPLQTQSIQPTPSEEPVLGDQDMEALLATLKTISQQNEEALALLKVAVSTLQELRTERRAELLAKIQEELGIVFAQLLTGNSQGTVTAPVIPSPTDTLPAPLKVNQQGAFAPEKSLAEPLAMIDKLPGKDRKGSVTLCGKTVTLPFSHASLFVHLINEGETMGKEEVARKFGVTELVGGGYLRSLNKGLEECKKGLSSCLTLVKSGRLVRYRFDIVAFRKAFGMK